MSKCKTAPPTPSLLRAVQQEAAQSDSMEPRIFWFGRTGLGIVLSAGTFPECPPHVIFFKAAHGKSEPVQAPDVSLRGNACSTMTLCPTIIGDPPVFLEQDDTVGASKEHLTLVPWESGAWGEA